MVANEWLVACSVRLSPSPCQVQQLRFKTQTAFYVVYASVEWWTLLILFFFICYLYFFPSFPPNFLKLNPTITLMILQTIQNLNIYSHFISNFFILFLFFLLYFLPPKQHNEIHDIHIIVVKAIHTLQNRHIARNILTWTWSGMITQPLSYYCFCSVLCLCLCCLTTKQKQWLISPLFLITLIGIPINNPIHVDGKVSLVTLPIHMSSKLSCLALLSLFRIPSCSLPNRNIAAPWCF